MKFEAAMDFGLLNADLKSQLKSIGILLRNHIMEYCLHVHKYSGKFCNHNKFSNFQK